MSVLEQMPVNELAIGLRADGSPLFDRLMVTAARRGAGVRELRRGESLTLGGATLDILHPAPRPFESDNDNSVAFVLRYAGRARALLADLSSDAERGFAVPDVDILLAAHHGSGGSTSAALLRRHATRDCGGVLRA